MRVVDLGHGEYNSVLAVQREYFEAVSNGGEEVLLLCEHPHVYTLGKSGVEGNILENVGVEVVRIDRGGDVTYHGPGQLVGYPILDLSRRGMGLREYIRRVEESIIRTLEGFNIVAGRSEGAAGVWLERPLRKIAAIGVRSSRYVTMHGFALNVSTDLRYFDYINPCGFTDRGVTSMAREGCAAEMNEVKEAFVERFRELF